MAVSVNKELIVEFTIPLYIRQYIKSNSIRAKYYVKGGKRKIPDKYLKDDSYGFRFFPVVNKGKKTEKLFLVDVKTEKRVIANKHLVGEQNIKNINGQDIYNGLVQSHDRNNLIGQIKKNIRPYIIPLPVIASYPIRIDVFFFDTIGDEEYSQGQDWDLDNRSFPYCKALADELKKQGKIVDDNRYYITEPPHGIFVPVDDTQDRKLVVRIYKDTRTVILNNYLYKKKHGWK